MNSASPARVHARALMAIALAVCVALIAASSASAVPTVSVVSSTKVLKVTGGSEDSDIYVSYAAGNFSVQSLDSTIAVSGTSCILVAPAKATCFFSGITPPSLLIASGAGTDRATVESTVPSTITAVITGVDYAKSDGAPLDVTTDTGGFYFSEVQGSPNPDRIVIDSPTACKAQVDGHAGDDEIYVDVDFRDQPEEIGCGSWFNTLSGGEGDDLIDASASKSDLRYSASAGHDVFIGGSGNDHITVGNGPDWAFGGGGNDRFYDNEGTDPSKIWGGPGNDTFTDWDGNFHGPNPNDDLDTTFYDGGSGSDAVAYHNIGGAHDVNLSLDGIANDGEPGETDNIYSSVEIISDPLFYGETGQFTGNDVLTGSNAPNSIEGQDGDDTITGLGGQDDLKGGNGNDEIFAEDGQADTISCGDGTDIVHADELDSVSGCETVL